MVRAMSLNTKVVGLIPVWINVWCDRGGSGRAEEALKASQKVWVIVILLVSLYMQKLSRNFLFFFCAITPFIYGS